MRFAAIGPEEALLLLVRHRPEWAYVDGLREFARWCCSTSLPADVVDRVQLVVQELIENAVKYSNSTTSPVELAISAQQGTIDIRVKNLASPQQRDLLFAEIEALNTMTAEQAYSAAMLRAATLPAHASRLGLARIRHEGGFHLSCESEPGGRVCVRASGGA